MMIKTIIKEHHLELLFSKGSFGIEKEGLRTLMDGRLALTPHPSVFGNRSFHPYIQTDFSESQLELVTPPQTALNEQYQFLTALHDVANRSLSEDEFIWPFSMPSVLPEEELIPIIDVEDKKEIIYREGLAEKYGKKKQMISGIHFNFSFSPDFLNALSSHFESEEVKQQAVNEAYLKLSRNFFRYQWVLTYLFGASPVCDPTFSDDVKSYSRSIRNSPLGYHNSFDHTVSYDSVKEYASDIEQMVEEGILLEEREYYGAARLRGKGKAVSNLLTHGIRYIELRSFDVNPFDAMGFSYDQTQLVDLFLKTMVWMDKDSDSQDVEQGMKQNEVTAMEDPFSESHYKAEGLALIEEMKQTAKDLNLSPDYQNVLNKAVRVFEHPELTLAARTVRAVEEEGSFVNLGISLGKRYKNLSYEKPFLLRGFDDMEMSTQLLLFDALQMGIDVDVLDKHDQFLELTYKGKTEYVRNANMTSKDSTISHWLMGNKTVTKKILEKHGYSVPKGNEFSTVKEAVAYFDLFKDKAIVIKPKSTNYGLGITIFKNPPSKESYEEGIRLAFKEDSEVLVEEFIEGTEYRFFVLNGRTEAVVLRIPANVTGDGTHTVKELIEEKNTHPYRGGNHRAPLEKIKMGEIEQLMLKEQGYQFDSILEKGKTVYLRENSNISTGGDSVDMTNQMPDYFKKLAEDMADALGVKVTGLDLIIPDLTLENTDTQAAYSVIEANYNPAMHMHAYVHKGEGQRLTKKVLTMLYPDIELS
ncbi:bifunctional glutamate--cysteine ligase GshA/glutathione synthetase GshB [Alkalibacterium sp. MB6]|uniref:bifunctional glutamate--cysteine ligase GshA/glutathione synthetase GshB n=1 Tax=Alkalibacterium sp. MB6 TaxID=2081965 RepID=UPI00137AFDF5